jgi:hypothetical protein
LDAKESGSDAVAGGTPPRETQAGKPVSKNLLLGNGHLSRIEAIVPAWKIRFLPFHFFCDPPPKGSAPVEEQKHEQRQSFALDLDFSSRRGINPAISETVSLLPRQRATSKKAPGPFAGMP